MAILLPTFRNNLSVPFSSILTLERSRHLKMGLIGCPETSVKTSWPLKMGPISCPETSVKECHSTLRNIPEEHRSHKHRGGSLKSQILLVAGNFPSFLNYSFSRILICHRTQQVVPTITSLAGNPWLRLEATKSARQCDRSVVFKSFFVRLPPDIISIQLCTPKVVGP